MVIEYTAGKIALYDNPLGVLTNSPTFDWMTTNLDNYINLSVMNVPQKELRGAALKQFGQGSGLFGLPGDYSPPSRFVRMVALTQAALPAKGAAAGLNQAITILDNVDIPTGAARQKAEQGELYDKTIWSVVADTANLRYYYRSIDNKNWRYVDLAKAVAAAKGITAIPVFIPADYPDVTSQGHALQINTVRASAAASLPREPEACLAALRPWKAGVPPPPAAGARRQAARGLRKAARPRVQGQQAGKPEETRF